MTALMIASNEGNDKIVQALLDKGAEINMKSTEGLTALMYAIRMNHDNVVHVLIKNGADVNLNHYSTTPLNLAKDKPKIARMLREVGAVE
jgi:serine/threonine-protein phosphatase 6 regulatory ankyrin repeat subunit B